MQRQACRMVRCERVCLHESWCVHRDRTTGAEAKDKEAQGASELIWVSEVVSCFKIKRVHILQRAFNCKHRPYRGTKTCTAATHNSVISITQAPYTPCSSRPIASAAHRCL